MSTPSARLQARKREIVEQMRDMLSQEFNEHMSQMCFKTCITAPKPSLSAADKQCFLDCSMKYGAAQDTVQQTMLEALQKSMAEAERRR